MKNVTAQFPSILGLILSSTLFALPLSAMGEKVVVKHLGDERAFLQAESCEGLKKQIKAFVAWSDKFFKEKIQVKDDQYKPIATTGKLKCEIEVTHLMPSVVQKVYGQYPACHGPNCFNASLISSGILPAFRYTTDTELSFWLGSKQCRERKPNEKMEPGDVIAIRKRVPSTTKKGEYNVEEIHAFTYLTPQVAFSKNGYRNLSKYSLYSVKEVYEEYGVSEDCHREYKQSNQCTLYGNVFTCAPRPQPEVNGVIGKKEDEKQKELMYANGSREFLCEIECQLQKMTWERRSALSLSGHTPYPSKKYFTEGLKTIQEVAVKKIADLEKELKKSTGVLSVFNFNKRSAKKIKEEIFQWEAIKHEAQATVEQMDYIPSYLYAPN